MKIWLMTLPFLCGVGVAMADDIEGEGPAAQQQAESAAAAAPAHPRMARHAAGRLPHGDIRHCLDMKTNAAIIRCAESRRKP